LGVGAQGLVGLIDADLRPGHTPLNLIGLEFNEMFELLGAWCSGQELFMKYFEFIYLFLEYSSFKGRILCLKRIQQPC